MSLLHVQHLVCPICAMPLVSTGRVLTCMNAHAFDVAREGYVNFLRKKAFGDTKEMVLARRNVFAQGHYLPLSDAVNEIVRNRLFDEMKRQNRPPAIILDAGCGEGYYLHRLQTYLAASQHQTICFGFDASKEAIRLAARGYQDAFFVVADIKRRLALAERCLHVIVNIFAPRNPTEFARVIAPGGLLLVVIPAPTHLQELRTAFHLLQIEEGKQQQVTAQFTVSGLFQLEAVTEVTYEVHLRGNDILQLVTMTPNYWHFTEERYRAMVHLSEIQTKIACLCLEFRRQSNACVERK
jgi:SAM-dependent methyltransferase